VPVSIHFASGPEFKNQGKDFDDNKSDFQKIQDAGNGLTGEVVYI